MGFVTSLLREVASGPTSNLSSPKKWLLDLLSIGTESDSGITINDASALSSSAVFACVSVLSNSVSVPPLNVNKFDSMGGKEQAKTHRLFDTLHYQPNKRQTSDQWRAMGQGHLALRGNFYNHLRKNGEIEPLHPDYMQIKKSPRGNLIYHYKPVDDDGRVLKEEAFIQDEILHLTGLQVYGHYGLSPIRTCMNAVGLALVTEKHGARLFKSAARPDAVIKHPANLSDGALQHLKDSIRDKYSNPDNSHGLMVLEEDMQWVQIGMKNDEAQFLETRKFQKGEIASIFLIPPHMIGDLERATFSNIEHQSINFLVHCLLPWIKRWEMKLNTTLLTEKERRKYQIGFVLDAFLRGDTKSRYEAYAIARQWGWMSINDIRAKEDWPLLPGEQGDIYLEPLNHQPAGSSPNPADQTPDQASMRRALGPVFRDAMERSLRKEANALRKIADKKSGHELLSWSSEFYDSLKDDMVTNLRPACEAVSNLTGKEVAQEDIRVFAFEYCRQRKQQILERASELARESDELRNSDQYLSLAVQFQKDILSGGAENAA